jgi:hypothetical protein
VVLPHVGLASDPRPHHPLSLLHNNRRTSPSTRLAHRLLLFPAIFAPPTQTPPTDIPTQIQLGKHSNLPSIISPRILTSYACFSDPIWLPLPLRIHVNPSPSSLPNTSHDSSFPSSIPYDYTASLPDPTSATLVPIHTPLHFPPDKHLSYPYSPLPLHCALPIIATCPSIQALPSHPRTSRPPPSPYDHQTTPGTSFPCQISHRSRFPDAPLPSSPPAHPAPMTTQRHSNSRSYSPELRQPFRGADG